MTSDEHFRIQYKYRFQEGEMRKRIQFMYGGEQRRVRFEYTAPSVEVVLDRLSTAKIELKTKTGLALSPLRYSGKALKCG